MAVRCTAASAVKNAFTAYGKFPVRIKREKLPGFPCEGGQFFVRRGRNKGLCHKYVERVEAAFRRVPLVLPKYFPAQSGRKVVERTA